MSLIYWMTSVCFYVVIIMTVVIMYATVRSFGDRTIVGYMRKHSQCRYPAGPGSNRNYPLRTHDVHRVLEGHILQIHSRDGSTMLAIGPAMFHVTSAQIDLDLSVGDLEVEVAYGTLIVCTPIHPMHSNVKICTLNHIIYHVYGTIVLCATEEGHGGSTMVCTLPVDDISSSATIGLKKHRYARDISSCDVIQTLHGRETHMWANHHLPHSSIVSEQQQREWMRILCDFQ